MPPGTEAQYWGGLSVTHSSPPLPSRSTPFQIVSLNLLPSELVASMSVCLCQSPGDRAETVPSGTSWQCSALCLGVSWRKSGCVPTRRGGSSEAWVVNEAHRGQVRRAGPGLTLEGSWGSACSLRVSASKRGPASRFWLVAAQEMWKIYFTAFFLIFLKKERNERNSELKTRSSLMVRLHPAEVSASPQSWRRGAWPVELEGSAYVRAWEGSLGAQVLWVHLCPSCSAWAHASLVPSVVCAPLSPCSPGGCGS